MVNLANQILERFSFEKNDGKFRIYNLIILILALSLYLVNNHFLHEANWFFMFYFNDFLAIVVLLSFLNVCMGISCIIYKGRIHIRPYGYYLLFRVYGDLSDHIVLFRGENQYFNLINPLLVC